jgi:pyruvate/2-oxoacid:ferredoxin oxidoreductase alpha subunit
MIVSFKENNKSYEIQDKHVDEIFNKVKSDMLKIYEQYSESDKDAMIALIASGCVTKSLMQFASNKYGVDDIIETVGGVEIREERKENG